MNKIADKFSILGAAVWLGLLGCSSEQGSSDTGTGQVDVTISGEEIATDGIAFPTGSEVTIVDGWELSLTHVLVTVGQVTLSENPDLDPSDQSRTGAVVARAAGPWAVDLHVEGDTEGASGEGSATFLTRIENQTERGGKPFALDERYALGYELEPATAAANIVNFAGDAEAEAAYAQMIEQGASVLYVGTAIFRGEACQTQSDAYDFSQIPEKVPFRLAFSTPAAFVNCQNQDNQGDPFPDEEYQRGIAVAANRVTRAQLTLHLEHVLFSATVHDPTLRFDQLAAQLVGREQGSELTLDDLVGVDPTAFTDAEGTPLPARSCDGSALPPGKQLAFDAAIDPQAKPSVALRDYRDFINYVQSAQGHLNGGEGLCFVDRHYPSPP